MLHSLFSLLFPPKCVFCKGLLKEQETDLCHSCRRDAPVFTKANFRFSFVARWTCVWYYKDTVRASLLRYKFYRRRSYASAYGRFLAMKLQNAGLNDFDVLTWVPVSRQRKWKRGYDQTELVARAVARELGVPAIRCLVKSRHNQPQSTLKDAARRRANVLGVYRCPSPELVQGKRVLLLDDIITTGSTISECAKVLQLAGAQEVNCAALAVAPREKKDTNM